MSSLPSSPSPDEGQAAALSSVKSVFSRKAVVRMQLLKEVVGGDSYRVNNKYDDNHTPLPVCDIIQRAQVLIGQEVSYDLLGSNCEHFVTLLRYGEGVSEQVSHSFDLSHFLSLLCFLSFSQSVAFSLIFCCLSAYSVHLLPLPLFTRVGLHVCSVIVWASLHPEAIFVHSLK